jgi:hypothetical protein
MENETTALLRADIEHYRRLLLMIGDKAAIHTLNVMIAEKEEKIRSITEPSRGR